MTEDEKIAFLRQQKEAERIRHDMEQALWIAGCNEHMQPLPYRGASKFYYFDDVQKVHNIIAGKEAEPHAGAACYLNDILVGR